MNYLIRNFKAQESYKKVINQIEQKKDSITISGLTSVCKSMLLKAINDDEKKPILLLTYNEIEAKRILKDLEYFDVKAYYFPKKEIDIYDYEAQSNNDVKERVKILSKIYNNEPCILIATIECLMQDMIPKDVLFENIVKFETGNEISLDEIKLKLLKLGYVRNNLVESFGEFSIRGDIIDIGTSENEGIRVELWGDQVDSIRKINLSTQRTTEVINKINIMPASENILEINEKDVAEKIRNISNENFSGFDVLENDNILKSKTFLTKLTETRNNSIQKDIEEIENGNYLNKIDKYFNEFYSKKSNIIEYCDNYLIVFDEINKIEQRESDLKKDTENLIKELISTEKCLPEALVNILDFDLKKFNKNGLFLQEDDSKENNFQIREINIQSDDIKPVLDEINLAKEKNKKVIVLAGNEENRDKIAKNIDNSLKTNDLDNIILKDGQIAITLGSLSSGFEIKELNLEVIASDEFVSKKKRKTRSEASNTFKSGEKIVFADLKENDLIVHKNYGIGIFIGIKRITISGISKDYICLKYRDGDILYIPTNNLDNVRKYIGQENGVQLNKLGTKEWKETKAKVKGNLRTVAKELIELYARREKSKGFAFSKDTPWQREFEDSFPYEETPDQLRCIEEVKKDMESSKPMDRLLCGDVGYGKTEVAMRAAFKAVMDAKQVCYLAPTTILANQQYQEFSDRMKNFPIKIELLNRFKTKKEQKEIVKKLQTGEIDIVIGTHRVLSKDVKFKDLGLLIIDEEHRFGVKDKEKIKQYKASVDVLTMTATPIPRTLQMSIVGIRDMSIIYNPPQNRKTIQTYVLEYDKEIIREAITKELERNGQVFYIFNNVEQTASKALEIKDLVKEAKVDYANGRMSGEEIEAKMQDFIDQKTNVLVCTTILESGIDIPNANTIIIENADRFGLAQLYQIRGRVGRSNRQAYAYITYRKDKLMSEDAQQRLKAIKEFTEFGSGFKIATRDLQIRGAGSLFGEVQSGHIEQVGYDMYNRLLNEVVKETNGEKVEEEEDITIDINLSSFIPDSYISDTNQKIEIYQEIADCQDENDIKNIIDEMLDRFGKIPTEVNNLIEIARIKILCKKANVIKVQEKPMKAVFTFNEKASKMLTNTDKNEKIETKNNDNLLENLTEKYFGRIMFSAGQKPYITFTINDSKNKINEIKDFLNEIIKYSINVEKNNDNDVNKEKVNDNN